jgi:hypothetical protein
LKFAEKNVCSSIHSIIKEARKSTSKYATHFLLSIYDSNESIDFVHNPKTFIEVLVELELFIDKKVILDEKKFPSVRRLSANFVILITFFPFNLDTFPFQVKVF